LALSLSLDRTARLWDLAGGSCLKTLAGHEREVSAVAVHSGRRLVATGGVDTTVRIWDLASGEPLRKLEGHGGWVRTVAFTPAADQVFSGCMATSGWVLSVALTADARWALAGTYDRRVLRFEWDGKKEP
jgi:WD40 repeat protein